ncbi:MAG: hypothetical protein MI867_17575 [Pseudomonadales bacterium]|nr:hypothetical protein [Pseudomonadales bacterium]
MASLVKRRVLLSIKVILLATLVLSSLVNAGDGRDLLIVNNGDGSDFAVSPYDRCEGCDPMATINLTKSMLGGMDNLKATNDGTSEGNHCDDVHCNCSWTGCNNFTQQCAGYGYTAITCITEVTRDGYPIGYGCECTGPSR